MKYSTKTGPFLCKILQAARHVAGLSQRELADKLERPQSYVAKIEQGLRRVSVGELLDLCQALAIDPADVIDALVDGERRGVGRPRKMLALVPEFNAPQSRARVTPKTAA